MLHAREALALGRTITFQFIRDADARHVLQPLEELTAELLCRLPVPPTLYQDVEDVGLRSASAPKGMPLTMDGEEHLIQVPLVTRLRAPAPHAIGILLAKLPTPLADGFMGHHHAALEQQFFHIAIAQGEAVLEPDSMTDDFTGKAVVFVTGGIGWRGHVYTNGR